MNLQNRGSRCWKHSRDGRRSSSRQRYQDQDQYHDDYCQDQQQTLDQDPPQTRYENLEPKMQEMDHSGITNDRGQSNKICQRCRDVQTKKTDPGTCKSNSHQRRPSDHRSIKDRKYCSQVQKKKERPRERAEQKEKKPIRKNTRYAISCQMKGMPDVPRKVFKVLHLLRHDQFIRYVARFYKPKA